MFRNVLIYVKKTYKMKQFRSKITLFLPFE